MTSLNKNQTPGMTNQIENCALFRFLPETTLECCSLVEWQVSQTSTNVEKAMVVSMSFVVKFIPVSGPTTTDAEDINRFLGFRHMSVGITSKSFGDGTSREGILLQGTGSIHKPRGLEARPE
jgi:hypothetical protein